MITRANVLRALAASTIVSVMLAGASLTVIPVEAGWMEFVLNPGFWIVFAQISGWYFLAGMLASVLTLFFLGKQRP